MNLPHVEGALRMAEMDIRVFPVVLVNGKTQPALKDPFGNSTTEPSLIKEWGKKYGMFGVACGESDLTVVDVDMKNGKDGFKSLGEEGIILPPTFMVATPSGGFHYYYDGMIRSKNNFLNGVDIKSRGGFVVAPGSSRPDGCYVIKDDRDFSPPPPDIPTRLGQGKMRDESAMTPEIPLDTEGALALAREFLATAESAIRGEGGDELTYKVACEIKDLGISAGTAVELMEELYSPRCQPPWYPGGIAEKVANAYRYGFEAPGVNHPTTIFGIPTKIVYHRASEIDHGAIPARQWILENRFAAGYISACVGPGGLGKSTVAMGEALSIASDGKVPCGASVKQGGPVWIHNTEDPVDEVRRRLSAFAFHFGYNLSTLPHEIFYTSGREFKIILAAESSGKGAKIVKNTPYIAEVKRYIKDRGIILWVVDPLVQIHALNENDNQQMASLMAIFQEIAEETGCAINLCHHTRKLGRADGAGDGETARGASSVLSACRVAYTLQTMVEEEARSFGIDPAKRRWYVRIDNAKNNLAAPAEVATWLKRASVTLPNGDDVGVIEPTDLAYFAAQRESAAANLCRELATLFGSGDGPVVVAKAASVLMALHDPAVGGPKTVREATSEIIGLFRRPVVSGDYQYYLDGKNIFRKDVLFG